MTEVTRMDMSGELVTVSVVVAVGVLDEYIWYALMVVEPGVAPVVTRPVLLIVAIVGSDTIQFSVGDDVRSCVMVVVPPDTTSSNNAVAENW